MNDITRDSRSTSTSGTRARTHIKHTWIQTKRRMSTRVGRSRGPPTRLPTGDNRHEPIRRPGCRCTSFHGRIAVLASRMGYLLTRTCVPLPRITEVFPGPYRVTHTHDSVPCIPSAGPINAAKHNTIISASRKDSAFIKMRFPILHARGTSAYELQTRSRRTRI
ncbi:hypothetical protein OH76DRAFT_550151 [Lentinus brumalis]|uniref:Uncharacterized protein n=1 Tax=Lentinus brumalis TaxID=2498619 RepID=A0A371D9X5_9APHY|nr:hypothetical protein OH76DRAFT_550151 [Polyporus brumalis]